MAVSMKETLDDMGVRHYTTLHGFSHSIDEDDKRDWFSLGLYYMTGENAKGLATQELLERVSAISGIPLGNLKQWGFAGREAISVANRSDAPACINAILSLGYSMYLNTGLRVTYDPSDAPYSIEKSEDLSLAFFKRATQPPKDLVSQRILQLGGPRVLDERLWKTEAGKHWCRTVLEREPSLRGEYNLDRPLDIIDSPKQPFDPRIDWPQAALKRDAPDGPLIRIV